MTQREATRIAEHLVGCWDDDKWEGALWAKYPKLELRRELHRRWILAYNGELLGRWAFHNNIQRKDCVPTFARLIELCPQISDDMALESLAQ